MAADENEKTVIPEKTDRTQVQASQGSGTGSGSAKPVLREPGQNVKESEIKASAAAKERIKSDQADDKGTGR
ncbi:hypothetical protein JL100_023025 [Skermanella mucosa]|uniref:hypothetical protein n=1 Tax=Skermanella mucosa TaxID=1789672 RepID=UPI00192BB9F4|nr:hypothetical protein [Skermanella mucosa]UEM19928.1 hypothetical protein JL100_023025 [Skermanella mucosa]